MPEAGCPGSPSELEARDGDEMCAEWASNCLTPEDGARIVQVIQDAIDRVPLLTTAPLTVPEPAPRRPRPTPPRRPAQRAEAAFRAIALRSTGVSLADLARPPFSPAFRRISFAGRASASSPVAMPTILAANWLGSLGREGRLGMPLVYEIGLGGVRPAARSN